MSITSIQMAVSNPNPSSCSLSGGTNPSFLVLLAALAWSRARGWGLLPLLPPTIAAFTLPGLILLGLAWGRADPTTALLLLLLLLLLAAFTLFVCPVEEEHPSWVFCSFQHPPFCPARNTL